MTRLPRRLALVVAIAIGFAASSAAPQTVPVGSQERGVKVLEPEIGDTTPTPAPPAPVSQPKPPSQTPVIQFCQRPFSHPDMRLGAASAFDRSLARRLRLGARVVVDLTTPFPEKATPPATLSPWFAAAQAGGGTVTVQQYCDAARGGLGSWLAQLFHAAPEDLYRPARKYDVVLHADALDHVVTQVEFAPRASFVGS